MAGIGVAVAGRAFNLPVATATTVLARSGILLGIFCTVAGSITIYDAQAAGQPVLVQFSLTLNAGWNSIPFEFSNGLIILTIGSTLGVAFAL